MNKTGPKQIAQQEWIKRYIAKTMNTSDRRLGVRIALFDAAHLCDAIAADIALAGRKSKRRDALVAIAKQCGDAIWALYEHVEVNANDATKRKDAE